MKSIFLALSFIPAAGLQAQGNNTLVKDNNHFAFDLYKELPQDENTFVSPYSISSALAMTYAGAKGSTATEMEKVLHVSEPATFHKDFGQLMQDLNALNGENVKMKIANRLFGAQKYKFLDAYLKQLSDVYKAPLEELDFAGKTEDSRLHINQWVEKQTNNKIKDLLAKGVINTATTLVLVNAIYFYGDWASKFEETATQSGQFHLSAEKTMAVKLMHQQSGYEYAETGTFKALRASYKGGKVSMEIYLPNAYDGLKDFEKMLTAEKYAEWSRLFRHQEVNFTLPKFNMTASFSLGEKLKKMGMTTAFSEGADFSGMTGHRDLFISAVIHKAFIDVNEKGTEAAAATAVVIQTDSVQMEPDPVKIFKADHPFFFVIRDNASGSILFMGRLMEPTKA